MADLSNIARHLPVMAERQPDRAAIKIPRGTDAQGRIDYLCLSFSELEAEAAAWQQRLDTAGVRRADRVLVMVKPGLPLIACVFALFAKGAVPVVIDPGMGLQAFLACVRRSKPDGLVGIPMARIVSRLARKSFASVRTRVGASGRLDARLTGPGEKRRLRVEQTQARDLAAILFTSGSTGAPKGVCYEHGMFEAQVQLIRETYDITPGEVDLPMLPVFALFAPALGMTAIIPEIDPGKPAAMDPARIVKAIQQEGVTTSFGAPSLWGKVADHCITQGITLPTIKRVLCAGAPVPAKLWEASRSFLPCGKLHSPYGATEALPVSTIDVDQADFASMKGAPVGRIVPGVRARIIPLCDTPIASIEAIPPVAPGEIGEIIVAGPNVTREYDALPEATKEAKIRGTNGEVWHRMGDAGYLSADGQLWFCGRKAERVQTCNGILFTEPCERVFRQHPEVSRCALVGVGQPGELTPVLIVERKPANASDARRLADELRALGHTHPQTQGIDHILFHPRFPVDVRHNAKIHRLSLARWAKDQTRFY